MPPAPSRPASGVVFARLTEVAPQTLLAHMADPRTAAHLPLAPPAWDLAGIEALVAAKEACWARDGLGHWAIRVDGAYVGWGGFQKEGEEWDFGLVLTPQAFGLGQRIAAEALAFARADPRIPFVTFLLPLSRRRLGALSRLGARPLGVVEHEGVAFRKFRLETPAGSVPVRRAPA